MLNIYDRLHEHGIFHGDPSSRNWLRGPDGHIRVVDFGHAHLLVGGDVRRNESRFRFEMNTVKRKLGLMNDDDGTIA